MHPRLDRTARATDDRSLVARIVRRTALHYDAGADAALDRPAHVRAASGLAWAGSRLVLLQDDANFVALIDPATGEVASIALPAGAGGRRQFDDLRGNKAHKLDLEAIARVPRADGGARYLAFGSGSTAARETIVTIDGLDRPDGRVGVAMHDASALYARLRAATEFSGSELNVEAALYVGRGDEACIRLFNRGNGAPRDALLPVNATCDVAWSALRAWIEHPSAVAPPSPARIIRYDLGRIDGCALGFTDAALLEATRETRVVYTAAAEASPDATRDGPVAGCAVGVLAERAGRVIVRSAPLWDESGGRCTDKVEGIALLPEDPTRGWVVIDRDIPDGASELCELVLEGAWFD